MVHVVHLGTSLNKRADLLHGAFDSPGNLVNILRLDDGLQVVFQDLREVVCKYVSKLHASNGRKSHTLKFGSTEVFQNFLPVRGVVVTSEIGLEFTTENFQGRTLSSTVGTDFARVS